MANVKVSAMTAILAAAIDAANDVVHLVDVSAGTDGDRKATPNDLVQAVVGANAARLLNLDATLAVTPAAVKVAGVASALSLGTTKIVVGTSGGAVSFFGGTPAAKPTVSYYPESPSTNDQFGIQAVMNALEALGLITINH